MKYLISRDLFSGEREIIATTSTHLLLMFDEIRSNVLFPGGRQGAVREPLHPDTLKVAEHAHASGCAWATTTLLVGDSPSDESHHQHSRCRRAHRTRARHPRRRRRCQASRAPRSLNSFIYWRTWRTFKVRCDVFLGFSWRAQQRSQPSSVIIRPLSSCRHLLRRSRSDLFLPPPRSVPMTPPLYRLRHNSPARALSIFITEHSIRASRRIHTCF